jgi:hypothetical protein
MTPPRRQGEPEGYPPERARPRRAAPPPPIDHPGLRSAPGPAPQPRPDRGGSAAEQQSGVRILRPQTPADPYTGPAVQPVQREPEVEEPKEEEPPPEPAKKATQPGVLGVSISDGVAHLAIVEPPAQPRLDRIEELTPMWHLDPRDIFGEFAERVYDTLRSLGLDTLAISRPLRYTNWTYTAAFERASLETCFLIAGHRLGMRCDSVGQHHAANVVGLPTKNTGDALRARLRVDRAPGWGDRWPALLVALAVLLEREGLGLRDAQHDSWRS